MNLLAVYVTDGKIPDELEVVVRGRPRFQPLVKCPTCPRSVDADNLCRFEGAWVCDGCLSRIRRERGISQVEIEEQVRAENAAGRNLPYPAKADVPRPTRSGRYADNSRGRSAAARDGVDPEVVDS